MKILKAGRKQKGWAKEFECTGHDNGGGGCGAKLLVEQDDLYETSHSDGEGGTNYCVTFMCSACNVETDINQKYTGDWCALPSKRKWMNSHGKGTDNSGK